MTHRICLWSGPRNVSTAVMYAFAQRPDTEVVDEPLYGHYLRVSGAIHPGRDEVMAAQNCDGASVIKNIILTKREKPILFVKQMAHHLVSLDMSFLEHTKNAFLIRNPREMLPSLVNQIPNPDLRDTGLALQVNLYDHLSTLGQTPVIVDARELLLNPQPVLEQLCSALGFDFDPVMMAWKKGGIKEDGVWAPHWYHNIHQSTGFAPYRAKTKPFPGDLIGLLDVCQPYYDYLYERAIKV